MLPHARYAPDYKLEIGGEPIPLALRASIIRINYQDGIEGADRVEVTIANEGLRWLDHPLLEVDRRFTLAIGYQPGPFEKVFYGEITGVSASFPSGGIPTLTVVAHDFLQRLTNGAKDRAFALSLPCIGKFPLPDPLVAIAPARILACEPQDQPACLVVDRRSARSVMGVIPAAPSEVVMPAGERCWRRHAPCPKIGAEDPHQRCE